MERKIIAVLILTGMLGAFAPFSPMSRAAAQVSNQGDHYVRTDRSRRSDSEVQG
jgi:fluoride ion exporter CrcB/FEX